MTKKPKNPFYGPLIVLGTALFITCSAYFVMTLQDKQHRDPYAQVEPPHPLTGWLNQHGATLLIGEIAALAAVTLGVMWWDQRHEPQKAALRDVDQPPPPS